MPNKIEKKVCPGEHEPYPGGFDDCKNEKTRKTKRRVKSRRSIITGRREEPKNENDFNQALTLP